MATPHTTEWVTVPQKDINKPEREFRDGSRFDFMISPSDIPAAFRVSVEPEINNPKILIVEFKYLTAPEDTKNLLLKDGIRVDVGKLSQKVFKIVLDLRILHEGLSWTDNQSVPPVLTETVDDFGNDKRLGSGNADAIKKVIMMMQKEFKK